MNDNLNPPNRIAILGATSQIAKDLIISFSNEKDKQLHLFARRPNDLNKWLNSVGLSDRYLVDNFSVFGTQEFDAIINFVGVGDPSQASAMGASIFDVTLQYDELALNYLRENPICRYIFLSSGAAYGSNFDAPVGEETQAKIAINNLKSQDWYAVAKLHAECRHRALSHLPIVDLRVFNYFSHTQDMNARFLITDIVRAIQNKEVLETTADFIERDFIGNEDFYQLINIILKAPIFNNSIDCYSKAPIDKTSLLAAMEEKFGLVHKIVTKNNSFNYTSSKSRYYSLCRKAEALGYQPKLSSIETIVKELNILSFKK